MTYRRETLEQREHGTEKQLSDDDEKGVLRGSAMRRLLYEDIITSGTLPNAGT